MTKAMYLWRLYWDCGRMGSLDGLFVATEAEIDGAIGKEVSFGDVLGKHSDIYGTFERKDVTRVDLKPETVEEVTKLLGKTWSGYNPLDYIEVE